MCSCRDHRALQLLTFTSSGLTTLAQSCVWCYHVHSVHIRQATLECVAYFTVGAPEIQPKYGDVLDQLDSCDTVFFGTVQIAAETTTLIAHVSEHACRAEESGTVVHEGSTDVQVASQGICATGARNEWH